MKKKLSAIFILGFLVFLSFWTYQSFHDDTYFLPIEIVGDARVGVPHVKVNIEDKEYFLDLDIGFSREVSIASGGLKDVKNKVFETKLKSVGYLGNVYEKNAYRIPRLKIGQMSFTSVLLEELNTQFLVDATFDQTMANFPEQTAGSIGSFLFRKACVYIDLYSSKMAFCDSFSTFKRKLKLNSSFAKVPFQFENGLVEFDLETSEGFLHCILDTGTCRSHINMPNSDNIPIKQFIESKKHYEKVRIGGIDFGPITFSYLPLNLPMKIDVILGVEFLINHPFFIDFINHELYLYEQFSQD